MGEKGSGKQEKITITNDKGRLSKEEIDKMVNDDEKFKNEDEAQRERISAKNGLESYIFNMESTLDQDQIKTKLSESDLTEAKKELDSTLDWLDRNQLGEKEEYLEKQKELESSLRKVVNKIYSNGGEQQSTGCGQQARHGAQEPTIEEVD